MNIEKYWEAVLRQEADAINEYFAEDACIKWHNTNEAFNVAEFIRANCEYPGKWAGEIEQMETIGDLFISVLHVWSLDEVASFHVTSFIRLSEGKIVSIDEYWGDDGPAPQWRLDKRIGTAIK